MVQKSHNFSTNIFGNDPRNIIVPATKKVAKKCDNLYCIDTYANLGKVVIKKST